MKCGIVVMLCIGMIACIRITLAGKSGLVGPTGPRTQVTKLPYCPINPNITALLNQISNGLRGKGCTKKNVVVKRKRIRRATPTFSYNCAHAALTYHLGELVLDTATATCCDTCDHPAFTLCVASNTADIDTRCPQEALQCIEQCIDTHLRGCDERTLSSLEKPSTLDTNGAKPGKPIKPVLRLSKPTRCGTTKKKNGKSFCIERSCIPINI